MIIGLNGRMRSGKDTAAQLVADQYPNVTRLAFADKLKQSACAVLGIDLDLLELLKVGDTQLVVDPDPNLDGELYNHLMDSFKPLTVRTFLQRYGTEAHRDVFADSFWIDEAFRGIEDDGRIVVVTDMRFPNEMQAVKERGGYTVKVRRDEAEAVPSTHASEQFIHDDEFDYILWNNGTIDALSEHVEHMMEFFYYGLEPEVPTCS